MRGVASIVVTAGVILMFACATALPSHAQAPAVSQAPADGEQPALLQADTVSYDRELGTVTASGHVEVSRQGRILLADTLTYNQRDDMLTANGNVSLLETSGEVIFAQYIELTGDLKDGIISDIRVILSDGARIAANGARRSGGNVTVMNKAVYSPCYLCADDPSSPPLWQIKAVKVTHDQKSHTVSYEDAWLEVEGIPVAYTPYFSHPDPTVKRRTGFLTPTFGSSTDLGFVMRLPYFVNISPSQDVTLTPIYTSEEGPVLAGEYRNLMADGEVKMSGSITQDSQNDVRGHIDSKFRYDVNDTWRMGADVRRATDDTYLRRYGFPSDSTLTSRLYAEGFRKRNYLAVNGYAFQGLQQSDDPGTTPLVLPMVEYHHVGEPSKYGARTRLDANLLGLTRDDGTDTRRLSVDAGVDLPYTGPMGDVYMLSASLRGDVYHVNHLDRSSPKSDYTGFSERLIPEVALHWRYPLVRPGKNFVQLVEPIASVIVSPYGGNPDTIPNEDSQDLEFDDTNLFRSNRFPGLDRVEGGPRFNYGMRWGVYGLGGGHTSFLVGQSVRLRKDDTFAEGSGLEDHLSDIVARAEISPGPYFDLTYKTRLDKENFSFKRNEVALSAGPEALRLSSSYVYFEQKNDDEFSRSREELRSTATAQLNRFWRTKGSFVYDLAADEARSVGLNVVYEDECLVFDTRLSRTFYEDRDIEPADSIYFTVGFKTLGEVTTQAY